MRMIRRPLTQRSRRCLAAIILTLIFGSFTRIGWPSNSSLSPSSPTDQQLLSAAEHDSRIESSRSAPRYFVNFMESSTTTSTSTSTTTTTETPPTTTPRPVPTTQKPTPPVTRSGDSDVWAALRNCESGGNYADDTGNGYYGAYQFSPGTWHSLGYVGLPSEAAPQTQDEAAHALQARSGWGQWPACARELGLI